MLYGYLKYLLSYFVELLFFSRKNKKIFLQTEKVKEILVINAGHIGELVLMTAFLANIKKIFPAAKVTLLAGEWGLPILANNSLIDTTIVYNSNPYNRTSRKRLSFGQSFAFILDLMKKDFDLIFDIRSDYWIMLYSVICDAKYRIDFGAVRVKKHVAKLFSTSPQGSTRLQHYGLQCLDMLDEIKPLTEKDKTLYLEIDDEAKKWVESRLMDFGINSHDFIAVIHPFAEWEGREWAMHKFAVVADYCASHYNAKVIITGKKEDKGRADEMVKLMITKAYNLAGVTTVQTFAALVSKACLFVCNDGGHMHIAAALNRPLIALFGPQTPLLFGPWSENSQTIYHKLDCSPCKQRHCTREPSCMELIEVEEVTNAIDKLRGKCSQFSQVLRK